ncbi:MAG TPA: hypothetical protein VJ851_00615 [Jatrophihabitans sp.]|nr:hypothetical protein [Jatrophihabitans sp.]
MTAALGAEPLKWLAANLLTGEIICDLPALVPDQSPFRRTLGQYETNQATLYLDEHTDPEWERGLLPWASVVVGYRGEPGAEVIEWAGIVNQQVRKLGNTVNVPLITGEGALDRCFVGAYTTDPTGVGATTDQNQIASDLVTLFVVAPLNGIPGLPITVVIVGGAGQQLLRTYDDSDDKTVYAALQELMGIAGGCEWTLHWQWTHNPERITAVIYIGSRIGTAVPAGGQPNATFEASDLLDATYTLDFSSRAGANIVKATLGSGVGRPTATAVATDTAGRPHLEFRYSPATAISNQAALQQNANGKLAIMQAGKESVQLVSEIKDGLRYGTDWSIGDDLGYLLTGTAYPVPKQGVTRCIGYETTDASVTPIVAGLGG